MPKVIGELRLYDVEELSALLGIQEKTIRAMLKCGRLKGRKLARRWYVSEENLRDYFNQPESPHDRPFPHLDSPSAGPQAA